MLIRKAMPGVRRSRGFTLMELMIAMAISLVVSLAMVSLMANTLGTGTNTIQMARLTQELRTALQLMTREARRANYHGNFMKCFANVDCRTTLDNGDADASTYIKAITISGTDCIYFWYDRDSDGDATDDDDVGAFRRTTTGGVGLIEMTIASNTLSGCASNEDWTEITDPEVVDVTTFTVSNAASYTDTIATGGTQTVDKILFTITGELVNDANITKTVQDMITVRNQVFAP